MTIKREKEKYRPARTCAILTPADYVRISCELLELPQAEIARRAGLKPSHLSEIIHGKRGIGVPVAKRLAPVLHVPVSKLIGAVDVEERRKMKIEEALKRLRRKIRKSQSIGKDIEEELLEEIDEVLSINEAL